MIELLFVVLPYSCALDWAGPAEAFRIANQSLRRLGQPEAFKLRFIGSQAQTESSVGAQLTGIEPLPDQLPEAAWVILLGSPDEHTNLSTKATRQLIQWLQGISGQLAEPSAQRRLVTVCAGALFAAKAGLLAHAQVTTHHLELDMLQTLEPTCQVKANRVFVLDDAHKIYSSAGITTGIDLAVHLIAQHCGEAIAARVAQVMVMPIRRGANDAQISPFLEGRSHLHPAIHRLQDALCQEPSAPWTAQGMAAIACTSTRHLNRLFDEHVGMSPLHYLRSLRLSIAKQALEAGRSVTLAARTAGFSSDLQLRRSWLAHGLEDLPSKLKNSLKQTK